MMTPKLIEAAMRLAQKSQTAEDAAKAVAGLLSEWQKIANGVAGLGIKRRGLIQECAKKVTQIDADLAGVRRACPHPATTHYADPCGRDSIDECDVCGGEV